MHNVSTFPGRCIFSCTLLSKICLEVQKVMISYSALKELLPASFVTKERGTITVKGKGEMTTFWLESKSNRASPSKEEVMNFGCNSYFTFFSM